MFNWFKKLFSHKEEKKKKKNLPPVSLKGIHIGDLIKLKFKDPKTIGFSSEELPPRIDYTDMKTRVLQGSVVGIVDFNGILAVNFLVVKSNEHGPYTRQYVFLEDEVEELEVISSVVIINE